jgi:hypothetical protein
MVILDSLDEPIRSMAKSRTSRTADVSNAVGEEDARNPLVLMNRGTSATRINAAIARV